MKKRITGMLLALAMALPMAFSTPAMALDNGYFKGYNVDRVLLRSDLYEATPGDDTALTQMEAVAFILRLSGLKDSQLGNYPDDYLSMAKSVGMLDGLDFDFVPGDVCTVKEFNLLHDKANVLHDALIDGIKAPLFINGMAQPIFDYNKVGRFCVYVESNYDTDNDGKLDLVKAVVQLPREAVDGMKVATIFEARPYIAGINGQGIPSGYFGSNGYDIQGTMYAKPAPRVSSGKIATTAEAVETANPSDWYYYYNASQSGNSGWVYEDLRWYDYYLVRGFAIVESAGIGTLGSEGFSTCGTDLEIDAFKCVIEWLTGDRVAYTDKTNNVEIKAEWSNGNIGMTGRSYAGTTQFGLATTGVKGLKTIVPVAGIASWYEYSNSQGISLRSTSYYDEGLAWHCNSRYQDPVFNTGTSLNGKLIRDNYGEYLYQLRADQVRLFGDYGGSREHYEIRDYTINWNKINCPALIVHGINDDNVRTKNSDLMYQAYVKSGQNVKMLLHLGDHMTPTFPADRSEMYIDEVLYDEILNKWFCHYLYGVDNGAENMPAVTAQSNVDSGKWHYFDNWQTNNALLLKNRNYTKDATTTINSDYTAANHGGSAINSTNYRDRFSAGPTNSSAMYVMDVTEDIIIKGAVAVNIRAAATNKTAPSSFAAASEEVEMVEYIDWDALIAEGIDNDTLMMIGRDGVAAIGREPVMVPAEKNGFAAASSATASSATTETLNRKDGMMMSAMLVDKGPGGLPFQVYNGARGYIDAEGKNSVWQGAGLQNYRLQKFSPVNAPYKIVARGWMDMYNPNAGYDSRTANERVELVPGKFYDYTIYMQPTVYTVPKGHTLSLVIYPVEPNKGGSTVTAAQNYNIIIDNNKTYASIPTENVPTQPNDRPTLNLTTDAHLVTAGSYFKLNPNFEETVKSNTAVLDFKFDKEKFEYRGFEPADGVKVLNWKLTDDGVQFMVMVQDYNTKSYGEVLFSAHEYADLLDEDNEIKVSVDFVVLLDDGTKEIKNEIASTIFTTIEGPSKYTLLTLSNVIDVYGIDKTHSEWNKYRFFDYNNNGSIDISDIAAVAKNIK